MKALLAESDLISVLAVALPLFVTTLTVARYRLSGEQTSLIFIDVFMIYEGRQPKFPQCIYRGTNLRQPRIFMQLT